MIVSPLLSASFQSVIMTLQHAVDVWEGGLKATCGAIVQEKTFWYLIYFKWAAGKWYYQSISDSPGEISIKDLNGNRKSLRWCEVNDAQEILGVHLAPDGNHYQQVCKIKETAFHWTDCMLTGCIPKDDAWLAFQSTIWKSMSYPLPAINITKEDCEKKWHQFCDTSCRP